MAQPTTKTVFAVEGFDVFGNWSAIGCWEQDGRRVNPTEDEAAARAFLLEMQEQLAEDPKLGWKAVRLAKTVTTHEVVDEPTPIKELAR